MKNCNDRRTAELERCKQEIAYLKQLVVQLSEGVLRNFVEGADGRKNRNGREPFSGLPNRKSAENERWTVARCTPQRDSLGQGSGPALVFGRGS